MSLSRFLPLLLSLSCVGAAAAESVQSTRVLKREAVIAQYADAQSKFIDVDGVKLHYKDQGKGPAVVLVHGTMGDLSDWDGWAETLSKSHRVLRFDIPGLGLSGPMASGNYSVDRMMTLVDAFMDLQGEERFAIAGISYGGLIAFRYAATRTARVSALLLSNSAGIEFGKPAAGQEPAPKPPAASAAKTKPLLPANLFYDEVITAADIEGNLRHMLSNHALVTPELVQRKLAFTNTEGRGVEARAARMQYERANPQRVLAHVRAPALVLWGGANKALSLETADAFVKAMKNSCKAERRIYPEGGHMLIRDLPTQTAGDALAFLASLPSAAQCGKN